MTLVLYQRLAPAGTLRVWLGAFEQMNAPHQPTWSCDPPLNGPTALRPLSKVQPFSTGNYSGVYEFSGVESDRFYRIYAQVGQEQATLGPIRSLVAQIPRNDPDGINFLLVSCFHYEEAARGALERVTRNILNTCRLDGTFLLGDQVYLDLPSGRNFPSGEHELNAKFEEDYVRNWRHEDYGTMLRAAPSISIPDDHEYWNNFPNWCASVQNSWTPEGRKTWKRGALALYDAFQTSHPTLLGEPVRFDIPPLSLFFADSRSNRAEDRKRAFSSTTVTQLEHWVNDLNRNKWTGAFICGQSLFVKEKGRFLGSLFDFELPDYGDFEEIVRLLAKSRHNLLTITGDVHWGRVMEVKDSRSGRRVFEIVSSPTALVTNALRDPLAEVRDFAPRALGQRKEWPRHSSPPAPLPAWAADVFDSARFSCRENHAQKGDQVAVLSFRHVGGRLEGAVTYWSLSAKEQPIRVNLFFPVSTDDATEPVASIQNT